MQAKFWLVTSRDTSLDARRAQLGVYARLGAGQRMELACQLSEQARATAIQGLRHRNPGLSAEEARRVLLRRLLGDALFEAAFDSSAPT
jgi:hypothetical protein